MSHPESKPTEEASNPGLPGAITLLALPWFLVGLLAFAAGLNSVLVRGQAGPAVFHVMLGAAATSAGVKRIRDARRIHRRIHHPPDECRDCCYSRAGLSPVAPCPECGLVP